ncbi:MAG: alpha-mannosidase, partial [Cyanobacteria bacterium J083]
MISKLQALTVLNVQNNWQIRQIDKQTIPKIKSHNWQNAQLNENNYIVWQGGRQVRWLQQVFVLPENLQGYSLIGLSLRLALTWWAEDAQIFVNGQLVQRGDLFDSSARVLLTPTVEAGEKITVHLRLVSPGHDIGALMNSVCVYERDTSSQLSNLHFQGEPGFFAQEIAVLSKYLAEFEPEKLPNLLAQLNTINWQLVTDAQQFDNHLSTLRQNLLPLATKQRQRSFQLLGHAHLDMAWLWTTAETYEVAQRTFLSVLSLQQDFPTLTFGHTTSALYEWIEINCPELFAQIQQAVKEGKWELLGGMWVEPEVNITGGESLVRQLLYGQKYLQAKFSQIAKVAWLPDSFGFTWQLPQILAQAGIEYFVTGKLHWNDSTKFPYGCFMWQSPDGTELLTMMSPPNLTGVMDTNPLTMANYGVEWEKQTGLTEALWLPGVGDHGGGPTRDMLEVGDKLAKSAFFPEVKFPTAEKYLEQIAQQKSLPLWQDELYLELHRGCYTTHAEQKKYNRLSEGLLYQAELFATIAKIILQQN